MNCMRLRVRSDEYYEVMPRKQILDGTTQQLTSNNTHASKGIFVKSFITNLKLLKSGAGCDIILQSGEYYVLIILFMINLLFYWIDLHAIDSI